MLDDQFAFYPSLKSMPVIISGGASGIGEEIVRAFAAQDSKVGFVDIAVDEGRRLEAEQRAAGKRFASSPATSPTSAPTRRPSPNSKRRTDQRSLL